LPFVTLKWCRHCIRASLPDGEPTAGNGGGILDYNGQTKRLFRVRNTAYFSDMRYYAHGVDVRGFADR